jgi:hypothetical protein
MLTPVGQRSYKQSYKTEWLDGTTSVLQVSSVNCLWSLYQMIDRYGVFFYKISKALTILRHHCQVVADKGKLDVPRMVEEISSVGSDLYGILVDWTGHGLNLTAKSWERFNATDFDLNQEQSRRKYIETLTEIDSRLKDELESIWFMLLTEKKAELYNGKDLFGSQVSQQFPSAVLEIEEAAKCLALGRGTATVFHCMRILEVGLNSFATALSVNFEHRNWENIINDLEAAIKRIPGDPSKPDDWKDLVHFYSEAAIQFRFFKDAWRNYSMHIHERYDPEYATIVFNSVKEFMRQLATRLHE